MRSGPIHRQTLYQSVAEIDVRFAVATSAVPDVVRELLTLSAGVKAAVELVACQDCVACLVLGNMMSVGFLVYIALY